MARAKQFEVYDIITDKLVMIGTAKECGQRLGLHPQTVKNIASGVFGSRKYKIMKVEEVESAVDPKTTPGTAAAWDAFCGPLRKMFGIPVYSSRMEG